MMESRSYKRWIWSELEPVEHESAETAEQPVARDYATHGWKAYHFGKYALCEITTGHSHIEAARQDHRLLVLSSLHSAEPLPAVVSEALRDFGVTPEMSLHLALEKLAEVEPYFLSEN